MNKLLILGIILINALTIHFYKNYPLTPQKATAYQISYDLLKENQELLSTLGDAKQAHWEMYAEGYSQFRTYAEQIDSIRTVTYNISEAIKMMERQFLKKVESRYFFKYTPQVLNQQDIKSDSILNIILKTIENENNKILQNIGTTDFIKAGEAEFQLDTNDIKSRLTNISVAQTLLELNILNQHYQEAGYFLLKQLEKVFKKELNLKSYEEGLIATVYSDKDIIQLGDTYSATAYFSSNFIEHQDSIIEFTINGKPIPFENNVATYEVKPTKTGKHFYEVVNKIKSGLTGKIGQYKRTFYYDVIDCKSLKNR